MIGYIINSSSNNPYRNLALEEYLLDLCRTERYPILYLWQNYNTVVVGRNQNLYTECNIQFINDMNIRPARRMTGGGAVYHDLGNLNYTIITSRDKYDVDYNTNILISALKKIGLKVFQDGRNDICSSRGKISGNAYFSDEEVGLQHGTILHHVDLETMEQALLVSSGKLSKRGIKSVRARVSDVVAEDELISILDIKESIIDSFIKAFGLTEYRKNLKLDCAKLEKLIKKFSSNEWIAGKIKEYDFIGKRCFSWGEVELSMSMDGEKISDIEISTDCIDVFFVDCVRKELKRCIVQQRYRWFPRVNIGDTILRDNRYRVLDIEKMLSDMLRKNAIVYAEENVQ